MESKQLILTCQDCGGANPRPLPYSMVTPDRCDHCPATFRTRFSVALMEAEFIWKQTKVGSLIESCVNTAVGYLIALAAMNLIMWSYGFAVSPAQTTIIVAWLTVLSVLRGYAIRRIMNTQFWKRKRYGRN